MNPALYLERVAGIEPASSAWKAEVLPLNYARETFAPGKTFRLKPSIRIYNKRLPKVAVLNMVQGGGFEPPKLARQIYSLIPLATREPLQKEALDSAFASCPCQTQRSLKTRKFKVFGESC